MKEKINEEINIDSLLLRIPLKYVEIIDTSLIEKHTPMLLNEVTGELKEKRQKYKPSEFQCLTYTRHGYILEFQVKNSKDGTQALYMLVNAKMLETKYFEGITIENVKDIYDRLQACNVAYFSFDNFLYQSRCTNVEFCKNFVMNDLLEQLKKLKLRIHQTAKKNPVAVITKKRKEQSLRFIAKNKSTHAKPHILIYNKELELLNNPSSSRFTNQFLGHIEINNLCRVEFRIKDKDHAKYLKLNDNSLFSFLNLTNIRKESILNEFTLSYLEVFKKKENINITPNKQIFINSMLALISDGKSFGYIAEILTQGVNSKSKSAKYNELRELYLAHIYKPVGTSKTKTEIYDILNIYLK